MPPAFPQPDLPGNLGAESQTAVGWWVRAGRGSAPPARRAARRGFLGPAAAGSWVRPPPAGRRGLAGPGRPWVRAARPPAAARRGFLGPAAAGSWVRPPRRPPRGQGSSRPGLRV